MFLKKGEVSEHTENNQESFVHQISCNEYFL